MTHREHVLIVGGGLAGPCLALSLARQNVSSTIFEIRDGIVESGGSISLGPDALRVLDNNAGIYDRIKGKGFMYRRMGAYLEDGYKLGEIAVSADHVEDEYPAVRTMRSDVHKVLLEAVNEMGDLVEVRWGAKLTTVEENEEGVTVHFADGSTANGDILVGADGIHSTVRKHVLGEEAPEPIFTNTSVVNGFLPASSAVIPSPEYSFPSVMFTPFGIFMTVPIDPVGSTLAWGITTSTGERTRDEWREFESSGEEARLAKEEWAGIDIQPIRSLLDKAIESEARIWTPYSIPDLPRWHTSKVCLIGDAAHALPPNGQGSTIALRDAALLARMIVSKTPSTAYDHVFARFEALRKPEVARIKASSRAAGSMKSKTSAWMWYFKKWALWGFFAWKQGIMRMAQSVSYDVDKVDISD